MYDEFSRQYTAHGFQPTSEARAPSPSHVFAQIGSGRDCTGPPAPFAPHRCADVQPRPLRERIMVPLVLLNASRATQAQHDAPAQETGRVFGAAVD